MWSAWRGASVTGGALGRRKLAESCWIRPVSGSCQGRVLHICGARAGSTSADTAQRQRAWRWGKGADASSNLVPGSGPEKCEVSEMPVGIESTLGATAAACGVSHSALIVDGSLLTFGSNKYRQLGSDADDDAETGAAPGVVEIEDGTRVAQASLGAYHSAVVTESGQLWTWGWGGSFWSGAGATGHGSKDTIEIPTMVERFADDKVVQVACGAQHTLVLLEDGRIYATGLGAFGRLGLGDTSDATDFVEMDYFQHTMDSLLDPDKPVEIVKVGAGSNFSAALSKDGELWLWGQNNSGQLGLGEESMGDMYSAEFYPRLVRSLAADGLKVKDFACGDSHIIVLIETGELYEWGGGNYTEPKLVSTGDLKDIAKLAGGDRVSFALSSEGRLYSWGMKASGSLAQGKDCPKTIREPTLISSEVFDHQRVVDVAASRNRCLAITIEDDVIA